MRERERDTSSALDAEEIAQERDHKVVVEIALSLGREEEERENAKRSDRVHGAKNLERERERERDREREGEREREREIERER